MKNTLLFLLFAVIGAFVLMADAFYNGFPIVYSDTSTYIASGFEIKTPFDRPITYGLFLRIFSLNGLSLWFVIFFQSLILSALIFLLLKTIRGKKPFLGLGLLIIAFLSLFTGLSWTVSQLMPDIFTAAALICVVLVLLDTLKGAARVGVYAVFGISVAMHMSHILLFSLLLLGIMALRKVLLPRHTYPNAVKQLMILLLLTISSVLTMGSSLSKSRHVFFMGAMVEHGIAKTYLDEYCDTHPYKLCAYKDSLPDRAYKFVWDEGSPFYKIGGWKETKKEFNEIIQASLTQPKYIAIHIRESLKATFQQLIRFAIGDGNGVFLDGTLLYERVGKYIRRDLESYAASRQNQSHLSLVPIANVLFQTITGLSLLLICFLGFRFRDRLNGQMVFMMVLFCAGICLNAWSCGTFANAIDRFGCKIAWLIPFMAILCLRECIEKSPGSPSA